MRILRILWCLACLSIAGQAMAIDSGPAFDDPETQSRYERIIAEVRCLTCQNQSIKDSNAVLASDLRREIREMISAGQSDEDIYRFLTERYGDFALYRPQVNPRTFLLWGAPIVLLAIGAFVILRVIRQKMSMPLDDEI